MRSILTPTRQTGFSLLEMALSLGVAGTLMAGIWQLMGTSGQVRDAAAIATQAQAIASASQQYINNQRGALLALGGLAAHNNVVRIKILDADTGATADSVAGAGFLPSIISNQNSYNQTYQLYVRREEGGAVGVDSGDKLVGLLISSGGVTISDSMGTRIASLLGAAGGFIVQEAGVNIARGTAGGWTISFAEAGWSTITVSPGRLAVLTNLTPQNISGGGGGSGGGSSDIDSLSDGATNYSTLYNLFIGSNAGASNVNGGYSTFAGFEAGRRMAPLTINAFNTALGYRALYAGSTGTTGTNNVAIGFEAQRDARSGSNNVAIGASADIQNQGASGITTIGENAGARAGDPLTTAIGSNTARCSSLGCDSTNSTYIGSWVGRYNAGADNTMVGAYGGNTSSFSGDYNVSLGYESLNVLTTGNYNTALGYRAGNTISSGSSNILIGSGITTTSGTANNELNIGNLIYGNLSTRQLNIGSATLTSGIDFDLGSFTSAARLAVGTDAQRPTCNAALTGAQRWRPSPGCCGNPPRFQYCDGTNWIEGNIIPGNSTPPTMPTYDGYIVLTETKWDGNLGGSYGIREKCLADLTTYDWLGKATAVANGQLIMGKVEGMLWWQTNYGSCGDANFHAVPNARYYFAVSNKPTVGGGYITTDSAANWLPDTNAWSGANQFNGAYAFWANSAQCNSTSHGCGAFTNNSSTVLGNLGFSSAVDQRRGGRLVACNQPNRLVCLVHP